MICLHCRQSKICPQTKKSPPKLSSRKSDQKQREKRLLPKRQFNDSLTVWFFSVLFRACWCSRTHLPELSCSTASPGTRAKPLRGVGEAAAVAPCKTGFAERYKTPVMPLVLKENAGYNWRVLTDLLFHLTVWRAKLSATRRLLQVRNSEIRRQRRCCGRWWAQLSAHHHGASARPGRPIHRRLGPHLSDEDDTIAHQVH